MIPYARSYTATVCGRFPKFVKCVGCQLNYIYIIEREAQGEGTSLLFLDNSGASDRAAERAEATLREKVQKEVDVVPCPSCATVQPDMAQIVRKQRHRWLLLTGMVILVAGGLIFTSAYVVANGSGGTGLLNPKTLSLAIAAAVLGVALMVLKSYLTWNYDPNTADDRDERLALARSRAIPLQTFNEMTQPQPNAAPPMMPASSTDLPDLPQ